MPKKLINYAMVKKVKKMKKGDGLKRSVLNLEFTALMLKNEFVLKPFQNY